LRRLLVEIAGRVTERSEGTLRRLLVEIAGRVDPGASVA
jgi:hypothetical protein